MNDAADPRAAPTSASTALSPPPPSGWARDRPSDRTQLVFCSRSGPPDTPWLEPDVNDHLEALATEAALGAVVSPSASSPTTWRSCTTSTPRQTQTAARAGPALRAGRDGGGSDPRFAAMLVALLLERAAAERGECRPTGRCWATAALWPDRCAAGCCANPQGDRPVIGGPR